MDYIVGLKDDQYEVYGKDFNALNLEIIVWIRDNNIGPFTIGVYPPIGVALRFYRGFDATAFKLRWA